MPETSGILYIVATPIGNLDDISARAVKVLSEVDTVLCEDTRHSGRLLAALGIRSRTLSMHEHNEEARAGEVIDGLRAGRDYALISDAGTPLISDPGYRLVNSAAAAGLRVSPVPGACAAVAALSVSGLPTDRFCFLGFLPARKAARRKRLEDLTTETGTLVFYESGRRLESMLLDCAEVLGDSRSASVAREM
ncbi:MAG: 16S rRNA (cytidine(1402)-2'-O)-methyltransferase, partial [Chromatiales bacterium]|nr:16S rRNA (cytidine(1402)-2'-O)-methyltransferase [Chromatiales bacterium]